jgi:hypothetical protein
LFEADGEKLEPISQAIAIPNNSAELQRIGTKRKRKFHRHNFASIEFAGQCSPDPIQANFGRAPPQANHFA